MEEVGCFEEKRKLHDFQNEAEKLEAEEEDRGLLLRQALANTGPTIMVLANGMLGGFTAIILAQLEQEDSAIKISISDKSWIASLLPLSMGIACLFSGWFMDLFGRRTTHLIAATLSAVSWLVVYYATTIKVIILGRVIGGFGNGLNALSLMAYAGEVTHPHYRGFIMTLLNLSYSAGFLVAHLLGVFLDWRTLALVTFFVPAVTILPFWYCPESPVWYINKNKFAQAKEAFSWYRGTSCQAKSELEKLFEDQTNSCVKYPLKDKLKDCCNAQFIKPFLIVNLYFVTFQFTGNNVLAFYTVGIMQSAVPNLDKYAAMLLIDVTRVIIGGIACVLIKKFRIRPLTMISGFGTLLTLAVLGISLNLHDKYPENLFYGRVPIIALNLYLLVVNIGLVPLAWAVCGELFPAKLKGIGGGISTCMNLTISFVIVKAYPYMFAAIGTAGTFTCYGVATAVGTSILFFVLPETKNKTLRDIEQIFSKKIEAQKA